MTPYFLVPRIDGVATAYQIQLLILLVQELFRETRRSSSRCYGPKAPRMTWTQRADAGVDAKHFQAAKGGD